MRYIGFHNTLSICSSFNITINVHHSNNGQRHLVVREKTKFKLAIYVHNLEEIDNNIVYFIIMIFIVLFIRKSISILSYGECYRESRHFILSMDETGIQRQIYNLKKSLIVVYGNYLTIMASTSRSVFIIYFYSCFVFINVIYVLYSRIT